MQDKPVAGQESPNQPTRDVWRILRGAAWACFGLIFVILMMTRIGLSRRAAILQDLRVAQEDYAQSVERLAALDEESRKVRELPRRVSEDHHRLLSMYRHCRSVDDFFLINKDLLVSKWDNGEGDSQDGLLYLPEGNYELMARAKLEFRNNPSTEPAGAQSSSPWGAFDHEAVRNVQGGKAMVGKLVVDGGESGRVRVLFDHQVLIDEPLPDIHVGGYSHSGELHQMRPLFRVKSDTDSIELIQIGFNVSDSKRTHSGRIRLSLHLKPLGPRRYWVLDPAVYWEAQKRTAPWLTSYRNGWYLPDPAP